MCTTKYRPCLSPRDRTKIIQKLKIKLYSQLFISFGLFFFFTIIFVSFNIFYSCFLFPQLFFVALFFLLVGQLTCIFFLLIKTVDFNVFFLVFHFCFLFSMFCYFLMSPFKFCYSYFSSICFFLFYYVFFF